MERESFHEELSTCIQTVSEMKTLSDNLASQIEHLGAVIPEQRGFFIVQAKKVQMAIGQLQTLLERQG